MNWATWVVLIVLGVMLVSGTRIKEGFATPRRSDIGPVSEGWAEEEGYIRDLRYTETSTDIQGIGIAADFCRAVYRSGDPDSLHIACAVGGRDGMDTMEYRSRSRREGFVFSRDDYWRRGDKGRMDYGRIVRGPTGEFYASCAVAGRDGFKTAETRDTRPPPAIAQLLEAYDGIYTWYRWIDDGVDYAQTTETEIHGRPQIPYMLKPLLTRGLQLNRVPEAPTNDCLRFGEPGQLALDSPHQIRAISFWIYWDSFAKGARVLECSNDGRKRDLVWIGVEGGGSALPPAPTHQPPAEEIRPDLLLSPGPQPAKLPEKPRPVSPEVASWVFEIWDDEQRIMRIAAPHTAHTGSWQHVALTTTDTTTWWPTWQLWLDGAPVATKHEGRTIPAQQLLHNFIGKHVRGCIADFRIYTKPLTHEKINAAISWMKSRLHPTP
jgi:hypothetical protein